MSAPLTALDVIVVALVLLSAVLAMLRGLTREVLSILSWVAAALAAVFAYLNPGIRAYAHTLFDSTGLADVVLVAGTFVVVLLVIGFITGRVSDLILDSRVGALDRTLGFVFGFARGVVLVAVAFLFVTWLLPPDKQPSWVRDAQTRPYMETAGAFIRSLLPEDPSDIIDRLPGGLGNIGRGSGEDSSPPDEPPGEAPSDGDADPSSGTAPDGGGAGGDLEDARLTADDIQPA